MQQALSYMHSNWQHCRWERDTRYYEITLEQDLWGQWIITRCWGSKVSRQSQTKIEHPSDITSAIARYQILQKERQRKQYAPVPTL